MGEKIKVVIAGINGRFGRASARVILDDSELELVGALGRPGASYVGSDVGRLIGFIPATVNEAKDSEEEIPQDPLRSAPPSTAPLTAERVDARRRREAKVAKPPERISDHRQPTERLNTDILVSNGFQDILARVQPDVVLDFTEAEPAFGLGKLALERGVRPVIGTSGLEEKQIKELSEIAAKQKTGAIIASNFSLGAVLMMEFARQSAAFYSNVEIVEMHHTKKLDAPSGTAMHTVRKIAASGNQFNCKEIDEKELLSGCRGGAGAGGVRVHSVRLPGLISHHEVIFGADGELLTIRHDAFNTNSYLRGILMSVKAVMKLDHLVVGLENVLLNNGQSASAKEVEKGNG